MHAVPTSADDEALLVVDIGGTTLKGAVFRRSGAVTWRTESPTFAPGQDALSGLVALLAQLKTAAEGQGLRASAIGLASPGVVDSDAGTVLFAANLGWTDLGLGRLLQHRFGMPVRIEHDARCGAIAERFARTDEPDYGNFVFVPIGTGVSVAVVTSGVLITGTGGAAGEFGHVAVNPGGDACVCGQRGCLEAYSSASSVYARYVRRGGSSASSAEEISSSLAEDPIAAVVWADAVEALAIGISGLTAVLDPAVVVIGGGLSLAGDTLLLPLRKAIEERLTWRAAPRIVPSRLGTHSGLVGAALLAGEENTLPRDFATIAMDTLTTPRAAAVGSIAGHGN